MKVRTQRLNGIATNSPIILMMAPSTLSQLLHRLRWLHLDLDVLLSSRNLPSILTTTVPHTNLPTLLTHQRRVRPTTMHIRNSMVPESPGEVLIRLHILTTTAIMATLQSHLIRNIHHMDIMVKGILTATNVRPTRRMSMVK